MTQLAPRSTVAADGVDVWIVDLRQSDPIRASVASTLSADERARAARFRFERDRRRFETGRGAVRTLLGRYLATVPARIAFEYGPHGKPELDARHGRMLHFNVSHSDDLLVCAIASDREVGIDVEAVRPVEQMEQLADRCFSVAERAALRDVPVQDRAVAFFNGWTRKEAFLKATGDGLGRPLERFTVSLGPGAAAALLNVADDPREADRWVLCGFEPAPGYVAALAIGGSTQTRQAGADGDRPIAWTDSTATTFSGVVCGI